MEFYCCVIVSLCSGLGRDLVVVVDDVPGGDGEARVGEDTLSVREVEDLNRGRAFVRNLLETGGSVLARSVQDGIRASAEVYSHITHITHHTHSTLSTSVISFTIHTYHNCTQFVHKV